MFQGEESGRRDETRTPTTAWEKSGRINQGNSVSQTWRKPRRRGRTEYRPQKIIPGT